MQNAENDRDQEDAHQFQNSPASQPGRAALEAAVDKSPENELLRYRRDQHRPYNQRRIDVSLNRQRFAVKVGIKEEEQGATRRGRKKENFTAHRFQGKLIGYWQPANHPGQSEQKSPGEEYYPPLAYSLRSNGSTPYQQPDHSQPALVLRHNPSSTTSRTVPGSQELL